jgi:hypothetical protein
MPKVLNPELKLRRAEVKRTALLSQLVETNREIAITKSAIARTGSKHINSFANRVRQYALNSTGSFTSRQVVNSVLNGDTYSTPIQDANKILRGLVKSGKLVRTSVNAADAKNSGQLVYTKAN